MARGPHVFEPLERRTFLTVTGGGFSESVIATGLREPTAMVVTSNANPDAYITERAGRLRMFRNGAMLSSPIGTLDVDTAGERGLLGIALPRRFALERFIYVCYVTGADSTPNLRVSKFPSFGQSLAVDFETVLLELPAWDPETNGAGLTNLGGGIRFGFDGTLYIGVGDSGRKENAPDLESPFGKVLRIKPDGSVPADNPFAGDTGWKKYVWASGLRDPAKIAVHPDVGITYINDPGAAKFDEVNKGTAGANYGWWQDEGPGPNGDDPIYAGAHQPTNPDELPAGHIAGGAFFSPGTLTFPVPFGGDYFFTDRDAGAIRVMDIEKYQPGDVELFATGLAGPIDIGSTPEGDLLVLTRGSAGTDGQIIRYAATGGPAIVRQPRGGSTVEGTTFSLTVAAEGRTPLTYQWRRNGVDIPSATAATYTTGSLTAADDGATFSVVVSNSFGTIASRSVTVRVGPAGTDPGTGGGGGGTGGGGGGGGGTGGGGGGGGVGNPLFPGKPPPEPMGPIDLVPQFITGVPAGALGGSRGRASLRVFNLGLDTAVGTLTVRLHLSRDDVMDSSDHAVMDAVKTIKVRPNTAKTFKLRFAYPSDVPEGSYQLLAQIDPANTLPETNETNNLAVAGGATVLAAPVVDVRTQIGEATTAARVGGNVIVPVTLFNAGNAPSPSAEVTIVVSLAPGRALAGATGPAAAEALATASPVFTRTVRLSLGAGRGKTLKLKFALPADLAAGVYTFAASIDTVNAIAEADEINNTAVAAAAVTVS